jgi:hypothetical protein
VPHFQAYRRFLALQHACSGSGAPYAIGAIRTGASIEDAMAVAAENDANTSAPFTTLEQLRK